MFITSLLYLIFPIICWADFTEVSFAALRHMPIKAKVIDDVISGRPVNPNTQRQLQAQYSSIYSQLYNMKTSNVDEKIRIQLLHALNKENQAYLHVVNAAQSGKPQNRKEIGPLMKQAAGHLDSVANLQTEKARAEKAKIAIKYPEFASLSRWTASASLANQRNERMFAELDLLITNKDPSARERLRKHSVAESAEWSRLSKELSQLKITNPTLMKARESFMGATTHFQSIFKIGQQRMFSEQMQFDIEQVVQKFEQGLKFMDDFSTADLAKR